MNRRVLCVDDDPNVLAGIQRNLRRRFDIETAASGAEALGLIERNGPYAVIVADMQMPVMNGVELLTHARRIAPDSVRIMLTGNADRETPVDAVNRGNVFRFLSKPCPAEEFAAALDAGLTQFSLVSAERELLESTLNGSVKVLTDVLSAMDPHSFGRAQQLRNAVQRHAISGAGSELWEIELAAMLAPIGCIAIPPSISQRARDGVPLLGAEAEVVARIPEIGSNLLSNIPRLQGVAGIVLYQKKNFDGSGFPKDAVAGEAIPFGSRLLRILGDTLDGLLRRLDEAESLARLQRFSGFYDQALLESLLTSALAAKAALVGTNTGREIKIRELRVGMVLTCDVFSAQGVMLIAAGNPVTPILLERIRNFAEFGGVQEPIFIA